MTASTTSTENFTPPTEADTLQFANFVKEHEEVEMIVPVLVGLFVTSRLQLRGANALIVNLGIASIMRMVFKELKNPSTAAEPVAAAPTADDYSNAFGEGVKIVHSVPGRIRLRIDQIAGDPQFTKHLERLLLADDHVISARINRAASSIAINYDAGTLSDLDLGLRLMDILNRARQGEAIA